MDPFGSDARRREGGGCTVVGGYTVDMTDGTRRIGRISKQDDTTRGRISKLKPPAPCLDPRSADRPVIEFPAIEGRRPGIESHEDDSGECAPPQ